MKDNPWNKKRRNKVQFKDYPKLFTYYIITEYINEIHLLMMHKSVNLLTPRPAPYSLFYL